MAGLDDGDYGDGEANWTDQQHAAPGTVPTDRPKMKAGEKTAQKLVQFSSGLSRPFIQRPVMTMLLTASIVVFGIMTYNLLAVNDLPAVDYPVIRVQASYPGADPETMANTIATPLEKQFTEIPGLELTTSSSSQGNTQITLQFDLSKGIDAAATDVQSAIQRASGQLPADLPSPPTFTKTNPNDQPVMYVALTSDTLSDGELYRYGTTEVSQRINILPGVSEVAVYGVKGAIRIKVDPGKLAARNLTFEELADAVRDGTAYSGAGQFDGSNKTITLRPKGQVETAEGYANLIVKQGINNTSPVYLRDVARVVSGVENERLSRHFYARGFHPPASVIVFAVSRQSGANAVQVAREVRALLPQLQRELPGSIRLLPTFDRSQSIVNSLHDVQATLVIAFVLVIFVIFVFLGRASDTLIPMVALPMSFLITFVAMWAFGYSINNLTLMALTLAIGFLVDDAIVFLENVVRRAEAGESIYRATLNSAGEISFTILSMTLSLAAVFIPLAFMPGLLGRIFREFAITIIVSILASGVVSLTLTPLMCSRILAERRGNHGDSETRTQKFVNRYFIPIRDAYGRTLDRFLDHGWIALPIVIACAVGVWFFFTHLSFTLLPTGDSGVIRGFFIVQEGASPEQQRALQNQLDPVLQANPAVDKYFTVAGRSGLGAGVFTVLFLKNGDRPDIDKVAADLRKACSKIAGVLPTLNPQPVLQINIGATGSSFGRYSYVLSGINPSEVYAAADNLQTKLSNYPGFASPPRSDLFRATPNLDIHIDRDRAGLYGVSTSQLESLLRAAYSQNYVYLIKQADDQYQVIVEAEDKARTDPQDFREIYVKPDNGDKLIPIRALTRATESLGLQSVNHTNQFTSVTFGFDVRPGYALGDVTDFLNKTAAEVLPPTVKGEIQGEGLVLQQLFGALPFLIIAAVFVMYVILGILYESYVHPITVLSTLFPAVVGGLMTLWLFNSTLSLYSVIGLFLLMGIVKKNGIMIVDFALHRLDEGYDRRAAIHEASVERFRPIIMTTLAALMGALPIALGFGADGSSRRPLGLVIVGGLIVSQLITLYITPVIYLALEWFQESVLDRVPFLRSAHSHHEAEVGTEPLRPAPANLG
jgi:HAE1 family hydrophobic/amphiphilic exporter-1